MVPQRLSDEQMRGFIRDGHLLVTPDLPIDFHQDVFRQTESLFEQEGNPGNNLIARIPAINRVFEDPAVTGALTGVLGPNYYMHPHRHCHYNPPGSAGQQLHKDGFSRRRHRTRWILAMYYPQDTTEDMGPTAIVPGTQYYNTSAGGTRDDETPLPVPAGTVAIVNYDIWHRGTANRSQKKRYMMKFLFYRMEEPRGPSWDNEQAEWEEIGSEHDEMWTSIWDWHRGGANGEAAGKKGEAGRSVDELVGSMVNDTEPACIDAAYELGRLGPDALPALMAALQADYGEVASTADTPYGKLAAASRSEEIRRNISYALVAVGAPAVPELIAATEHEDWWVRDTAVEALGDIGLPAREAVPSLIERLEDGSQQVRRHASEALGMAGQTGPAAVPALAGVLRQDDEVGRRNAALALARIGPSAHDAVPALKEALWDDDRYVRGKAVEALKRIGTPDAREPLIDYLMTSRWCDLTTADSLY